MKTLFVKEASGLSEIAYSIMSEKFLIESSVSRETHAIRTFFIHVPLSNFV